MSSTTGGSRNLRGSERRRAAAVRQLWLLMIRSEGSKPRPLFDCQMCRTDRRTILPLKQPIHQAATTAQLQARLPASRQRRTSAALRAHARTGADRTRKRVMCGGTVDIRSDMVSTREVRFGPKDCEQTRGWDGRRARSGRDLREDDAAV